MFNSLSLKVVFNSLNLKVVFKLIFSLKRLYYKVNLTSWKISHLVDKPIIVVSRNQAIMSLQLQVVRLEQESG